MIKFKKGAEWRQWDLHIHVPTTVLANKYKNKDFNEFYLTIENNPTLKVIGITDYYITDGIEQVLAEFKKGKRMQNIESIIPNIEVRLDSTTKTGQHINLHILCNPSKFEEIKEKILTKLKCSYADYSYYMKKNDLEELGKAIDSKENLSDLEKGVKAFKIKFDDLSTLLEENPILQENILLGISNSNNDGNSGWADRESSSIVRNNLYKKVDFIFSSNPKDRDFFLTPDRKIGIKPCLHGSDAHELSKIGNPDLNRYLWIKSDPNFYGLKQVINEPEARVMISDNIPNKKINYNIIDKVRFIPLNDYSFSCDWIEINENLNTIIGGKSSGKSLLLYCIAKTLLKDNIKEIYDPHYDFNDLGIKNFEVMYKNGEIFSFFDEKRKNITYLPQMYLNDLVEKNKEKLDELIFKIILKNEELKIFYDSIILNNKKILSSFQEKIDFIFHLISQKVLLEKDLTEYALNEELEKEINELRENQINLEKTIHMSDKEKVEYNNLKEKLEFLIGFKNAISIDIWNMGNIPYLLINDITHTENLLKISPHHFKIYTVPEYEEIILKKQKDLEILIKERLKDISQESERLEKKLIELQSKNEIAINDNSEKLKYYEDKISNIQIIKQIEEKLIKQNNLLSQRKELEIKIESLNNEIKVHLINLRDLFKQLKDNYKKTEEKLKSESIIDNGSIKLNISTIFNNDALANNLIGVLYNKKSLEKIFNGVNFFYDNEFEYNEDTIEENIYKLSEFIIFNSSEIKLKKEKSIRDLFIELYKDYFNFYLDLEQDNEKLSSMSPGKKGLILFQLYLQFNSPEVPILVDQPEDNLDNRTIYKILKDFIIQKKIERQIIMVTHNANLVVATDSEEVIVSNQMGDNSSSENKKYRFEYISGALENSFTSEKEEGILYKKGIKEHVCEILEGGEEAFKNRERKYHLQRKN